MESLHLLLRKMGAFHLKSYPKATFHLADGIFHVLSTREKGKKNRGQRSWKKMKTVLQPRVTWHPQILPNLVPAAANPEL